ncbi:restriction endonuclease subunit S [Clostridium perfringens]|nr:restriction endonuclease subunit S [Clostridium perfringens]
MGISSYICREQINVFSRDSLTIDMFGNVFFRGYEYGADDHVTVLENNKNKFSRYVLQFIQPLIEKFIEGKFAYSRNFYPKDSYDIKIKLPINNGKLDSEFMEKFIIVVQKLVIKDLVICANKKIEAMKRLVYES